MTNTPKVKECYVDMEFLNPGPWLYNFTVDVMRDLGKEMKPRSIIRIMNGFLNLEKPKIPISYIPKYQIHRVITGRKKLRKYTNLEELCIDEYSEIHDSGILEKKIRSNAKYIVKKLTDDKFRQSSLFESILINARGLYEDVESFVIKIDEFIKLRRMAELDNLQNNNEIQMDQRNKFPDNQTNTISIHISCINKDMISDEVEESNIKEIPLPNQLRPGNKQGMSLHIPNLSVERNFSNCARLVNPERNLSPIQEEIDNSSQNIDELLPKVSNNCKTYEEFVQSTNVTELAAKVLNYINHKDVKKQLEKIIIQNTWKQIQALSKTYDIHDKSPHANLQLFNTSNVRNTVRYTNMDKNILPVTYLRGLHNIFPNPHAFVKYTNVIRLLKENHSLNVEGITTVMHEWYDDLLKNPQTINKKYFRLKVNAKYLFQIHYEQPLITYNNEMLQEELYRQFIEDSSVSHLLLAFPVGVASRSSDIPGKQFNSQNTCHSLPNESLIEPIQKSPNTLMNSREIIRNISNENMEMDLELNLNIRELSSDAKQNEKLQDADNSLNEPAAIPLEESHVTLTDTNIVTTSINSSSDFIEALPTTSTLIPTQLGMAELDTSPKELLLAGDIEDSSIQKSLQDISIRTIEYVSPNKSLSRTNTLNPTIEHLSKIPTIEHETEQFGANIEKFYNFIKEINKAHENFEIFPTSAIKEKIMEKLDNMLNAISHNQKATESHVLQSNNNNVDLDATQINQEMELIVKTEPQSQYSLYSDDVEIIANVSEIIQVEDSMTVSQLLASDDDQTQNNIKQNGNECYDLLKELKLNNSVSTDDGLLQRIDAVLDETNVGSDNLPASENLELSYNDLIQHPNITKRKRERRKRKADTENQQNEIINGCKVKPVNLRHSSYTTVENQHVTTTSQLLNTEMSLFFDSQLSISKQTSTKQPHSVLPPLSKGNCVKKREAAKRKLYENGLVTEPHIKSNLTKRAKLIDYNIIIKSLHNFKLINIQFLKNFYIQNRNKYIFSQNTNANVDRINATLYAKYDRFTIRNQYFYKLLNLNKKQICDLKALLHIYEVYEFKLNNNYTCDVSLLILHLYFRTIPSTNQNALILNVHSKDVENLYDRAEYLNYKYDMNGFNRNKLIDLYHNAILYDLK